MAAVEGSVSSAETLRLLDGGFSHTTNTHPEIIAALYPAGHEYNAPTLRMSLAVAYLLQGGTVSADRELRPAVAYHFPQSEILCLPG